MFSVEFYDAGDYRFMASIVPAPNVSTLRPGDRVLVILRGLIGSKGIPEPVPISEMSAPALFPLLARFKDERARMPHSDSEHRELHEGFGLFVKREQTPVAG